MSSPSSIRRWRIRGSALTAGGAALLALGGVALLGPTPSSASSHREAPLIAGDPKADNTDLYAFVSPDRTSYVNLIANWIPFEEPNGGPNFYPFATDARYNIKIDNTGDGVADVTYSWYFQNHYRSQNTFLYNTGQVTSLSDPDLNFYQTYFITRTANGQTTRILNGATVAPSNTGVASFPNYRAVRDAAVRNLPNGGKAFAGQADDPFFLDLRVFDLLYGADLTETGHDTLNGYNVNTLALQVPKTDLVLHGNGQRNPVIGVWSTTDRRSTTVLSAGASTPSGSWVQVSRLGNPLVNEVVVPVKYKDAFNGISPDVDHTVQPVVDKVLKPEVPKLIQSIYGIQAPPEPRNDLVEIFLTGICKACGPVQADLNSQKLNRDIAQAKFTPAEELRLNVNVPPKAAGSENRLGVLGSDLAGFPNGRRLTDDVIDIGLQALEGVATGQNAPAAAGLGDGVNTNDVAFGTSFPYVALPHTTSVNNVNGTSPGAGVGGIDNGDPGGFTPRSLPVGIAALLAGLLLIAFGATTRRRTTVAI